MPGDHLAARQLAGNVIVQHSLDNLNSGISYKSVGAPYDYNAAQASSHRMPRKGLSGVVLNDVAIVLEHAAANTHIDGMTVEVVYATTLSSFNFFSSVWNRTVQNIQGFLRNADILLTALNDGIGDTQGRIFLNPRDINGSWVSSRTTHQRIPVTDGLPHHIAYTWEPGIQTNALKLYIDGVHAESVTLLPGATLQPTEANSYVMGVEAYFTQPNGSFSHACATLGVLSLNEIRARANLVNGGVGSKFTDQGQVMGWDAANNTWVPYIKGYSGSAWLPVRKA
jgi:hypothetical protein